MLREDDLPQHFRADKAVLEASVGFTVNSPEIHPAEDMLRIDFPLRGAAGNNYRLLLGRFLFILLQFDPSMIIFPQ
jgi:hypothetical protein